MTENMKLNMRLNGVTWGEAWPFVAQAIRAKCDLGPRSQPQVWSSENYRASVWRTPKTGVVTITVWRLS